MDAAKYRPDDPDVFGEPGDLAGGSRSPRRRAQLEAYFAGALRDFDLPLAPRGDDFHQRVWALLREIPYGETRSYGDLARALGDRNLAQAVGTANGRNPIAVVIPCHRVIGPTAPSSAMPVGSIASGTSSSLEEPHAADAGRLF